MVSTLASGIVDIKGFISPATYNIRVNGLSGGNLGIFLTTAGCNDHQHLERKFLVKSCDPLIQNKEVARWCIFPSSKGFRRQTIWSAATSPSPGRAPTKNISPSSVIKRAAMSNRVREELNTAKFGWFHIKAILVAGIGCAPKLTRFTGGRACDPINCT